MNYMNFMKHAKKVTKSVSATRPVLEGVLHGENELTVTDSHRLYHAKVAHALPADTVITPDGAPVEGSYPNIRMENFVHDDDSHTLYIPDAKLFANIAKTMLTAAELHEDGSKRKKAEKPLLKIEGNVLSVVDSPIAASTNIHATSQSEAQYPVYLDARYFLELVEFFKDAAVADFTIRLSGNRPIIAETTDKNVTVILMTVRRNQ